MKTNETACQVILDVDGVITTDKDPNNPAFEHVISASLEEIGAEVPDQHDKITLHWGTGPKRIFLKLLEECHRQNDVPEDKRITDRREGINIFDKLMYSDFDEMTRAIPGVAETLNRLKCEGVTLAVNSASELGVLRDITFPKAGISLDLFDEDLIWTSDRLLNGQEKPSPYPIHQIIMTSGIPKEKTIMVGDSMSDVYCAQQADVTPVVVLTGNVKSPQEAMLYDVLPGNVIEDLSHIDGVIYRSLGWAGLESCGVSCPG